MSIIANHLDYSNTYIEHPPRSEARMQKGARIRDVYPYIFCALCPPIRQGQRGGDGGTGSNGRGPRITATRFSSRPIDVSAGPEKGGRWEAILPYSCSPVIISWYAIDSTSNEYSFDALGTAGTPTTPKCCHLDGQITDRSAMMAPSAN